MSELAFNRIILQRQNKMLSVFIGISLIINLILGFNLYAQINRKPILVTQMEGELKVLERETYKLDEEMLKNFTIMVSTQYLNFTSLTLPKQVEAISKYLDVQPVDSIMETFKKNEEKMLKGQVAHEFSLEKMEITKKNAPFWIELHGKRTVYVKENKKEFSAVYLFEISKILPTKENPYGLIVTKIIEKKDKQEKESQS